MLFVGIAGVFCLHRQMLFVAFDFNICCAAAAAAARVVCSAVEVVIADATTVQVS